MTLNRIVPNPTYKPTDYDSSAHVEMIISSVLIALIIIVITQVSIKIIEDYFDLGNIVFYII